MRNIKVIKRDLRLVDFDANFIQNAIKRAMDEVGVDDYPCAENIANDIAKVIEASSDFFSVEKIQDMVEEALMESSHKDVARAYILYRDKRSKARNSKSDEVIAGIINAEHNDITRENANSDANTPAGMMAKIASERSKEYVDNYLIPNDAKQFIDANLLYPHDKDYWPTRSLTCIQHPMDKLLKGGFVAGHGESRPAKRIETASILCAISLETVQNLMHGGQAIPALDYYLAPYVRKTYIEELKKVERIAGVDLSSYYDEVVEDYIEKSADSLPQLERLKQLAINETVHRVHQAMEAFIHNMNTIHSRAGNQVVFSSVNYGTDTSAEGRCVIRELLLTTERGVGGGSTAIFPIQIWKLKAGVSKNPGDRNYDLYQLACRVTARRFFPNFLNLDASFNQDSAWVESDPRRFEHEVACMGCRTRVYENRHGAKTSIGRGNLSFSTINLPGLAMSVMNIENENERVQTFFKKLIELVQATVNQLYERYKFQCEAKAKQFPLLMSGMWKDSNRLEPEAKVEPVLKHGTLGVGFIGLAECLIALIGKHHGESMKAQELGLTIIGTMKALVDGYANKLNLNFSVLATPAEGLSGKFTKKDRIKYGVVAGITDKDYYTNSNHVPVYYHCSANHKAAIEGPYHELTRGGHIFYVEMDGDATHNIQAIDDIVKLMDKHNIGYASINHNRNRCLVCGFENAEKDLKRCPNCGSDELDTIQRITGYLVGGTSKWNSGKLAELKDRIVHE